MPTTLSFTHTLPSRPTLPTILVETWEALHLGFHSTPVMAQRLLEKLLFFCFVLQSYGGFLTVGVPFWVLWILPFTPFYILFSANLPFNFSAQTTLTRTYFNYYVPQFTPLTYSNYLLPHWHFMYFLLVLYYYYFSELIFLLLFLKKIFPLTYLLYFV